MSCFDCDVPFVGGGLGVSKARVRPAEPGAEGRSVNGARQPAASIDEPIFFPGGEHLPRIGRAVERGRLSGPPIVAEGVIA